MVFSRLKLRVSELNIFLALWEIVTLKMYLKTLVNTKRIATVSYTLFFIKITTFSQDFFGVVVTSISLLWLFLYPRFNGSIVEVFIILIPLIHSERSSKQTPGNIDDAFNRLALSVICLQWCWWSLFQSLDPNMLLCSFF